MSGRKASRVTVDVRELLPEIKRRAAENGRSVGAEVYVLARRALTLAAQGETGKRTAPTG